MQIETLDKALSLSNKIAQLEAVKTNLINNPGFGAVIKSEMDKQGVPEAIPSADMLNEMEVASAQFNQKWVKYIDEQIGLLQAEFEAL